MQLLGIGEIARQAGVAASTIRYYEEIGLLPVAKRVNTKRRYEPAILQRLGVIRMAQQAGLTLAEIQDLLHGFSSDTPPSERWQTVAPQKIDELDDLIQRVQAMKSILEQTLQCECATIDDCAD